MKMSFSLLKSIVSKPANLSVQILRNCSTVPISSSPSASSEIDVPKRHDKLFEQINIEVKAHQPDVLKSYSWFATAAAKELNILVLESWAEPEPHKVRKTLLRSAFVHSKHRVQYEFR